MWICENSKFFALGTIRVDEYFLFTLKMFYYIIYNATILSDNIKKIV